MNRIVTPELRRVSVSFAVALVMLALAVAPVRAQQSAPPAVSVESLVAEALEANPELAAMRRDFDAARARVPQAKALPDPTVRLGIMSQTSPVPFAGPGGNFDEYSAGFTQMFPWFGVRRLRGEVASSEAEASLRAYEARALELAADVRSAAYELYATDRALAVVTRDTDILEKFTKVAEARYEVGKGSQADVVNARLQITDLLDVKGRLEAKRETTAARINALLDRSADTAIGPVAAPPINKDLPSLDELVRRAEEASPALAMHRRQIDARSQALRLAERQAKYPEVGFGFDFRRRPEVPATFFGYTVTIQLPLYSFNKQRYAVEERASQLAAARSRLESTDSLVRFKLSAARTRAATALRLIELHEQGLVPQSALALESSMSAYQVGEVDFLTLLTALKKALDYETHYYELWADYQTAMAEIEALTGARMTRP